MGTKRLVFVFFSRYPFFFCLEYFLILLFGSCNLCYCSVSYGNFVTLLSKFGMEFEF